MENVYDVIKKPLITEKSSALAEVAGQYAFEVALDANKFQIRDAVQRIFNVKVDNVRTSVVHGKFKRFGRTIAKRPNWKKAIVTVAEGQKIEFFQA